MYMLCQIPDAHGPNLREPYMDVLSEYGAKFAVYFTVERAQELPGEESLLKSRQLEVPSDIHKRDQFIEFLKKHMPEADFIVDQRNAAIIHLIDVTLRKHRNYVLDTPTSISFSGTPYDFLNQLKIHSDGKIALPSG